MVQSIFEEMGGRYERQGEYILPCLTIPPEKEQSIDLFGRRHLDYLREYRKITYTNLLTSGRLNAYLADIDRQAQEHFERLIEGMKQAQGITECLKEENALEWTGRTNNIRACPLCPFRSVPVREMALECAFQKKVEKSKMRPSARRGRAQRKCKQ